MEVATAVIAWAIASTCRNLSPSSDLLGLCPRQSVASELQGRLSSTAQIFLPGTGNFTNATSRWSALDEPGINIVVVPSTEDDVAATVQYANSQNISYLAVNGGHGAITTVGKLQNGIEIWMHQLSSVKVSSDGKSATIGGGTLSKTVIEDLWAAGKQTVTGACECVSVLGPALGGGHGFLQGRYGLVADQFLSMNIVMADGKIHTIDSTSDVWWAIKGAGHNFGIVTSFTSKVYDIVRPNWAYASFIFTGDKVESLYEATNKYLLKNGTQPVDIINYSFFFNMPSLDPAKPLIMFYILQEGVTEVDSTWTKPFQALGPIATDGQGGTYMDVAAWTGNGNQDPPCQKAGLVNIRFPIDTLTYDPAAQREVYDMFADATQKTPALNGSLFLFEGYSLQAVQAVPSEQTAFPFRGDRLLISPLLTYAPAGPELDKAAKDLGEGVRQVLYKASGRKELHTYVNYAFGDETDENWYGPESWRQEKLKALKQKYDPLGKFSFYAPIA
ncbi:FAD binding domain protein [Xylaria intraflava]|nr:FAD binding domain protein [Xylaria intraflava]